MLGLANTAARLPTPSAPETVVARRAAASRGPMQMSVVTAPTRTPLAVVDHRVGVDGGMVRVRRYRPADHGDRPLATHVFAHGGCYWLSDIDDYDPICRWYAAELGAQVVSVDYRLAPEHPYPVPVEDCYAALSWVAERAGTLGVDPARLSVGGISAGGGLAAALALLARDRSGPALCAQVLEQPMLDPTLAHPSVDEYAEGFGLTREQLVEGWDFYVPDPARRTDPYAAPMAATDLTGLPPAIVLTAECDPLRDEGEAYADRLAAAGVPVERLRVAGHVHGSPYMTRLLPSARDAVAWTVDALRRAYA